MATAQENKRTRTTRTRTTQEGATKARKDAAQTTRKGGPRRRSAQQESAEKTTRRTATLPVPVVTPHVTVHKFHVPAPGRLPVSGQEVVDAGKAVTSFLPPPNRLAYYTGLGTLAAVGLMEWPVAVAIGVGVGVARRAGRSGEQRRQQEKSPAQGE